MSKTKDYYMWLESKGIAISEWEDDDLIQEYKRDEEWHCTHPNHSVLVDNGDGDFTMEEDDDDCIIDDGDHDDYGWSPCEFWIHPDDGLTGDALDYLHNEDLNGDFC